MAEQDTIITIVIVCFSYALIPQVYQGFKNKKGYISLQTSGITAIGMYILAIVYYTLGLIFSATISIITATIWTTLFVQKIIYK